MSKVMVSDEMLIADVLRQLPEAADVMQAYGLHCTTCSVNTMEPVKAGAMAHGIPEETVDEMIAEINRMGEEVERRAPDDGIYLSERGARKIEEFAAAEEKGGFGLKVTAEDNGDKEPIYTMDFQEKSDEGDLTFEFHGIEIFLSPASLKNMLGAEIDFVETPHGSGFKIDNPLFKTAKKGSCGCGGECGCGKKETGTCGSGGCGCK